MKISRLNKVINVIGSGNEPNNGVFNVHTFGIFLKQFSTATKKLLVDFKKRIKLKLVK